MEFAADDVLQPGEEVLADVLSPNGASLDEAVVLEDFGTRNGLDVRENHAVRIAGEEEILTVEITIHYEGDLRCRSVHAPSGSEAATDAPVDNQGKGETFSPTDLVATAWGSCMLTIMGIVAERHGIDLKGTSLTVQKHMVVEPVRRIGKLEAVVEIPTPLSWGDRKRLQGAAENCPVHHSLAEETEKVVDWRWTELENKA